MTNPTMSILKQEIDIEIFLEKIRKPEGFCVLIEDYYNGRFELHVYRPRDMMIYVTTPIYNMLSSVAEPFAVAVNDLALTLPPSQLIRYQW